MLSKTEHTQAAIILAKKHPAYRRAYSDRTAWLMAYMSELAYLKFDKPDFESDIVEQLVRRSLRGATKGTREKIFGIIQQRLGYDHAAESAKLQRLLQDVGIHLEPISKLNT